MNQRLYQVDPQLQNLYAENTILREKANKISEIQPYVHLLLQNNKNYQEEIANLQIENNKLRGKVDDILEETILVKETHKNQISALRNGLEGDIERLVIELKQILRDKEAMQNANRSAVEELQSKFRRQLQGKRIQIEEIQRQTDHHIRKLTQTIKGKDKQLQNTILQGKNRQIMLNEKIEKLGGQIGSLLKNQSILEEENKILNEEKQGGIKKNKQLMRQNQQISTRYLRSEQDKNQSIIHLKNYNRSLTDQIQMMANQIRNLQKINVQQNRKINNLTRQCDQISNKYNELDGINRRNLRQMDELQNEYNSTVEKLQLVSKTTTIEIGQQTNRISSLLDENKKLSADNIELQADNRDKKAQIEDLLRVVDRLEAKVKELDDNCTILQDQNTKYREKNKIQQVELSDCLLQKKGLSEKLNLYVIHNKTLEQMVEKEKRRNMCLENSRNEFEHIALSRGDGICKQYEQEIEKIVQDFVIEKKQSEEKHAMEISNIRKIYEASLREKDDYFSRKIQFLQKEICGIKPFRSP